MTAPPKDRAAIRDRWTNRLERIDSQLTQAYVHRHIWEVVSAEILRVNPSAEGEFLTSYTQVYAESVMMTIRRLADKDPASESLWAIWDSVRRHPYCATRADYVETAASFFGPDHPDHDSVRRQSDHHFTDSFGTGSEVDPSVIKIYQVALRADAELVAKFVDKRIAHLDTTAVQAIDLSEIHDAMDRVANSANHLHRLLDRTKVGYEHVNVPPGWRSSLHSLFS